jgi:hypothetical protein
MYSHISGHSGEIIFLCAGSRKTFLSRVKRGPPSRFFLNLMLMDPTQALPFP